MTTEHHAYALQIVHSEAKRTLSKEHFDLCMRIAKRALAMARPDPKETSRIAGDLWDASINCDFDAFKLEVANALLQQGSDSPEAVNQEYKPEPVRTYPEELTPALREVLGMMLWHTTPIAHALRASGQAIARKVEDEQAVVLHWLTGIVLQHGDEWQKNAAIELRKLTDTLG